MKDKERKLILPEIKMGKAIIRKTFINENEGVFEREEEINVPIFDNELKNKKTYNTKEEL